MLLGGFICDLHAGLLWQGSLTGPSQVDFAPAVHIHCAPEAPKRIAWATFMLPMTDDAQSQPWDLIGQRVLTAAEAIRAGKRVVVTCFAGINRSALVAALVLLQVTDMTPDEVIAHIRNKNTPALDNQAFVAHLQGLRKDS